MKRYITIDGGTTNTRIYLVENKNILKSIKLSLGAKDCTEDNSYFKKSIKEAIENILKDLNLTENDITAIIASGMITSESGLFAVKHTNTPAGLKELHNSIQKTVIEEISSIPFCFISGVIVKNEDFLSTDMMRGEETEIFGLLTEETKNYAFVLPGSHSKIITLDSQNRIESCVTLLTGEMIFSLWNSTILKDSFSLDFEDFSAEYLEKGYDACLEFGINQAIFKTRILKNIFGAKSKECYSYFLGVIFADEIKAIKKTSKKGVVIGGKASLKLPMAYLIKAKTNLEVIALDDVQTSSATVFGAIKIFETEAFL